MLSRAGERLALHGLRRAGARRPPRRRGSPFAQAAPWLAGLLGYAVVLLAPQVLNDGDSSWHIAAGGWMLDHARILRSDVFSFTFNGRPWHTHEWLAEALMALTFRAAGWSGVILLYGAATGSAMAILARQLRRNLDGPTLAVALLLAFACVTPSLLARPHLLALPLLAAWTAGLLRRGGRTRAAADAGGPDDALGQSAWRLFSWVWR